MSVPVVRVSVEFKCDENEPPLLAERQPTYTAALAKCGVERTERSGVNDRGPTFCLRRRPPQEPPEGKRLPGAEGPPEGKRSDVHTPRRSRFFIWGINPIFVQVA